MDAYYKTIQGDTWDLIAYKVYGDEKYADFLMQNNYPNLDTLVFSSGVKLYTPELPQELEGDDPPWKENEELEGSIDPYD